MPRYIEELVSQQVRKSELAHARNVEVGDGRMRPVVTISRRKGSGARLVAAKLADDLGWSLWNRDLVDAIAQDADVSRRVVEAFDEKAISEMEMFARSALGDYEMGDLLYARHLTRALAAIARLGNAVIVGRGASFVLPDALHVWIDASDEVRIRNMMTYENLDPRHAEAAVHNADRESHRFFYSVFGREKVESGFFDITIWMDHFGVEDAVEIIKTAIRARFRVGDSVVGTAARAGM